MTTFSQAVDRAVAETGRVNLKTRAEGFCNETIREMHTDERSLPVFFSKNRVEIQITAVSESGETWIPPKGLQIVEAVNFPTISTPDMKPVFARFRRPGRRQNETPHYFYRTGNFFVFSGYGGIAALINISHFVFPPRLKYFAIGSRPAEFDDIDGFTYFDLTGNTPPGLDYTLTANQPLAEALVTNWFLQDWEDTLNNGIKAAMYRDAADTERARLFFSRFGSMRLSLVEAEEDKSIFM